MLLSFSVFFFQAEDGIRDYKVTGVQTCALPILAVYDTFCTLPALLPSQLLADGDSPAVVFRRWMNCARVNTPAPDVDAAVSSSHEIGRASCRGRVEISVVAGSLKKKKKKRKRYW